MARYTLLRDGQAVQTFDDFTALVDYIHQNHPYSFDHAMRHEGYSVQNDQGQAVEVVPPASVRGSRREA